MKSYGRKAVFQSCLGNKQKEYFKTHTQSALKESKALEKRVDDEIARVAQVLKEKREPKLTGF